MPADLELVHVLPFVGACTLPFPSPSQDDLSVSQGDDRSAKSDDASSVASDVDDRSTSSNTLHRRHGHGERRSQGSRRIDGHPLSAASINYHGVNISQAAGQGNLPLCVLLWGMATAKRVNLMDPDPQGNTPMHFAALADLPEVLGFLQQQGRTRNNSDKRLLDSRNGAGETPLLRAASIGKIPTLKFLLEEGSDPFATDKLGNTIFIILARFGHIWGLHFVYSTLCDKFGQQIVHQLLSASDRVGNNALDWAADTGDVNVIEYLMRRNLYPTKTGKSTLHVAVKSGKLDAVRFLVKCGCNPFQEDIENHSPMAIAKAMRNREIISIMNVEQALFMARSKLNNDCMPDSSYPTSGSMVGIPGGEPGQRDLENGDHNSARLNSLLGSSPYSSYVEGSQETAMRLSGGYPDSDFALYADNRQGDRRPHALRRLKPSRFKYTLVYALITVGYWILTVCIPFYAWLALIALSFLLFRYALSQVKISVSTVSLKRIQRNGNRSYYQEFMMAPEKYLGLYLGMSTTCLLFWLCSLRIGLRGEFLSSTSNNGPGAIYLESLRTSSGNNLILSQNIDFLNIGGLSGSTDDYYLFWCSMGGIVLGALLWAQLVWISPDPGALYSRDQDFDMIMDQCLHNFGTPSSQLYCRTTLVKKPLRSKFCTQTGLVIARMDHYCVWLNNSVGYGNHRTFMVFLFCQLGATTAFAVMLICALDREVNFHTSACGRVSHLLDRQYFFATALCGFLCIVSLGLAALLIGQSIDISKNMTTNERLNRLRYPWMNDEHGNFFNHFDRGFVRNVFEFWGVPGFEKDYLCEFNLLLNRENIKSVEKVEMEMVVQSQTQISGINPTNRNRAESSPSAQQSSIPFNPPVRSQTILSSHQNSAASVSSIPQSRLPSFRPKQLSKAEAQGQSVSDYSSKSTESLSSDVLEGPKYVDASIMPSVYPQTQGGICSSGLEPVLNSVLTRQQEAKAQFDLRIQHAINLSKMESPAARSSRGMSNSASRGSFPGLESVSIFRDENTGSNKSLRSTALCSNEFVDRPIDPEIMAGIRSLGGRYNNFSPSVSAEESVLDVAHSSVSQSSNISMSSPHDRIPPYQSFLKTPLQPRLSDTTRVPWSSSGNMYTIVDADRDRKRELNEGRSSPPNKDGDGDISHLERSQSAPNSPARQFTNDKLDIFTLEPAGLSPSQIEFDERVQRSINLSKIHDDELMSLVTEPTLSDDSHYSDNADLIAPTIKRTNLDLI